MANIPVSTAIDNLLKSTTTTTVTTAQALTALGAVTTSGALGTPISGTLTNATDLPIVAGTSGTLTVARGGTGATTLTSGSVLVGAGASTPTLVAPSTSGNVLTSNGTTWTSSAPTGSAVALQDLNNSQPNVLKKFTSGSAPVRLAFMGDSLMALGRPSLGPLMGEVGRFGQGVSVGTVVSSFDNWVTGKSTSLAIGQTGEFSCGFAAATPTQGTRFTLYYIKESGAGTFDLEFQTNGTGAWTRFTVGTNGIDGTVNAANATPIGAVFTATLSLTSNPSYKVRITNITTGPVKIIGAGIYYHQGGGVIAYLGSLFYEGGVDFPNPNTTPVAILNPIIADMQLDCVISCWADAGAEWDDGGGFDLFYDKFIAQYSGTDFVQLSTHPLTIASAAAEQAGFEKQRQWAIRNNQTFLNCWEIFKGSAQWMADNGLKSTADDPHLTTAGGLVRNANIWSRLTIGSLNLGSLGSDTIAGDSGTVGQYFTLQGGDPSPQDAIIFANRPIIFRGSSGAITLQDRNDQFSQTGNSSLFNVGGEFFLSAGSNNIATSGTSSFGGWHPASNGRTLGGRGSFFWNIGGAGVRLEYAEKSANYSILATDYTINVTANSPTITLPDSVALNPATGNFTNAAAGAMGKIYIIKNSGAGVVTIATTNSELIDGSAPGTLATGASIKVQSTGTGWITVP